MNTIEIFCCYAQQDLALLLKLKAQLGPFLRYQRTTIDFWYEALVLPGVEWEGEVYRHLNSASIILLLISSDFMASDHCDSIAKRAMERYGQGEASVIPVILRSTHWQKAPFGTLQALPQDAQPVALWRNLDEALCDVAEGINKVIESLLPSPPVEDLILVTRPRVPALISKPWQWDQYAALPTLVLHHSEPIASITLSSDKAALVSDGWDNTLISWKVEVGKVQRKQTLAHLSHPLYTVSFKPNDLLVAGGGDDAIVRIWHARTGREVKTLKGHTGPISCVAFSPDGQLLASASDDHTIQIWHARTGREVKTLKGHTGPISCVAFSPDGQLLASASFDTTVKVWNPSRGDLLSTLTDHRDTVHCVSFLSPVTLASGDHQGLIFIWRNKAAPLETTITKEKVLFAEKWDVEQVLQQPGPIYSIAPHLPSGALISGAHDGIVRVWEPSTGQILHMFTEHRRAVSCVAVSSTGDTIASGSLDKTIQIRQMKISRRIGSNQPPTTQNAGHWLSQGIQHISAKQYELALKDYERAFGSDPQLVLRPTDATAIRYLYRLPSIRYLYRLHINEFVNALSECKQAIRKNPQDASAHLLKSYTLLFLGKPQEALSVYEQAVALESSDDRLPFLRNQIYRKLQHPQYQWYKSVSRYLLLGAACGIVLMGIELWGITSLGYSSVKPFLWIGEVGAWVSLLVSWGWSLLNTVRLRLWKWVMLLSFVMCIMLLFSFIIHSLASVLIPLSLLPFFLLRKVSSPGSFNTKKK